MITPPGPITVVVLVVDVDYISELTIHSVYVHHFCVKEMYKTSFYSELDEADCAQLVLKYDSEIVTIVL